VATDTRIQGAKTQSTGRPGSADKLIDTLVDGKYRVEKKLGEGAMGVVYAGTHVGLGRPIALKTLKQELSTEPSLLDRFEQEARAASAIGHPNIVQVFDLGSLPGGGRYMVMEYLSGSDLGTTLSDAGPLPLNRVVPIFEQLLSALGAAHERGIVHRDLKPDNLMITRIDDVDHLKIVDFGISKVLEKANDGLATAKDKTAFGAILGTPAYMAPEQVRGQRDLDQRCDIWSCGIVLFELLVGRTPWVGETFPQILAEILEGSPAGIQSIDASLPDSVDVVLKKALAKDREQRYASAAEMRAALTACLSGSAGAAPPAPVSADDDAFVAALDHADLAGVIDLDGPAAVGAPAAREQVSSANAPSFAPPSAGSEPLELESGDRRFAAGYDGTEVKLKPEEVPPREAKTVGALVGVALLLLLFLGATAYLTLR